MQGEFSPGTSGTRKEKKASDTGFPLRFWSITLKYKLSSITIVIPHMFTWTSVLFLPTDLSLWYSCYFQTRIPPWWHWIPHSGLTGTKTWSSWSGTNTTLTCSDFQPKPQQWISRINSCPLSPEADLQSHTSAPPCQLSPFLNLRDNSQLSLPAYNWKPCPANKAKCFDGAMVENTSQF